MNLLPINFNLFSKEYSDELLTIQDYFKKRLNVDMYLIYGTLLGAFRQQTFLKHDNDIDISYLSNYTNRIDVQKELLEFHKIWKQDGILIKTFESIGQTHILSPDKKIIVDVWSSWIENDKYYLINSINGYFHKDILLPFKTVKLEHNSFLIPNQTIPLLQYDYGTWDVDPKYRAWEPKDRSLVFHYLPRIKQ
ncbi:MAG: LicD family protein [Patescibacteria group bacterium]|jgi:phosphorylcholine metabolism protein LicD